MNQGSSRLCRWGQNLRLHEFRLCIVILRIDDYVTRIDLVGALLEPQETLVGRLHEFRLCIVILRIDD